MTGKHITVSYEEPSSAEFVKEELNDNEDIGREQDLRENLETQKPESRAVKKENKLSGFFVHIKVENEDDKIKLLKSILSNEKHISSCYKISGKLLSVDVEDGLRVQMESEVETIVEVDIQQDTDEEENCTPLSEVISCPLAMKNDALVAIPDQIKTEDSVVIQPPSMDQVEENEGVTTNISVKKNSDKLLADDLEDGLHVKVENEEKPVVEVDIQQDTNAEGTCSLSSEIISCPLPLPSHAIVAIPDEIKTQEDVIQSPSINQMKENEAIRTNISVKDEPIVVVEIQQDTSVEGNSTPSSEVISSPLPLPSDSIVVIPKQRKTQKRVIIESSSVDHVKENESVTTNISVKDHPKNKSEPQQCRNKDVRSRSSSDVSKVPYSCRILNSSTQKKTQNRSAIKSSADVLKKSGGVRNDTTVVTTRQTLLSGREPYVLLERLENLFIQTSLVRSPFQNMSVSSREIDSSHSGERKEKGVSDSCEYQHYGRNCADSEEKKATKVANSAEIKQKTNPEEGTTIVRRNSRGYLKTPEGKLKCEVCGKEFKHSSNLTNHIRRHTGERPFLCKLCGKTFRQVAALRQHFLIHTGETRFECDICKRRFNQHSHVLRHMRIHTGETPYKCELCGREFAQSSCLKVHMRVHTGEMPYQCPICKRSFAHAGTLKTHVRSHTGETPHKCKYCRRGFNHRSSLTVHIRIHTGETPYKCSYCPRAFARRNHFNDHIRSHTGETPYRCNFCPKAYSRSRILTAHLLKKHVGEKHKNS